MLALSQPVFARSIVQGQLTYRIADAKRAAAMLDVTIDARGRYISKRNFRRKILQQGIVEPSKEWQKTGRKPAQFYRFSDAKL